jgi:hypothetical protein
MAVRSTMSALIARTRLLINDPSSATQQFADQDIQDILDESRADIINMALIPKPTFTGALIQYLNYYTDLGGWEDDLVLKQFLVTIVTPTLSEPIAGHWQFATTTLPPIYLTGKTYDIYRGAADLLERWAARYVTRFDFTSDGQSFRVSQAPAQLQALAKTYRMKQRAHSITAIRSDLNNGAISTLPGLAPTEIDYFSSGS